MRKFILFQKGHIHLTPSEGISSDYSLWKSFWGFPTRLFGFRRLSRRIWWVWWSSTYMLGHYWYWTNELTFSNFSFLKNQWITGKDWYLRHGPHTSQPPAPPILVTVPDISEGSTSLPPTIDIRLCTSTAPFTSVFISFIIDLSNSCLLLSTSSLVPFWISDQGARLRDKLWSWKGNLKLLELKKLELSAMEFRSWKMALKHSKSKFKKQFMNVLEINSHITYSLSKD